MALVGRLEPSCWHHIQMEHGPEQAKAACEQCRGEKGGEQGVMKQERTRAKLGRSSPGEGQDCGSSACSILSSFLGQIHQHKAMWIYASCLADTGPVCPIVAVGLTHGTRGQMSPYLEESASVAASPIRYSSACARVSASAWGKLERIGLPKYHILYIVPSRILLIFISLLSSHNKIDAEMNHILTHIPFDYYAFSH